MGPDGLVRSVTLRTQMGRLRRPIVKLALLERQVEEEQSEQTEQGEQSPVDTGSISDVEELENSD